MCFIMRVQQIILYQVIFVMILDRLIDIEVFYYSSFILYSGSRDLNSFFFNNNSCVEFRQVYNSYLDFVVIVEVSFVFLNLIVLLEVIFVENVEIIIILKMVVLIYFLIIVIIYIRDLCLFLE